MIKQQLSSQATHMLSLDSKIHVLCTKGNQRTEIWEECSTIIAAIKSPQFKRDATYDENSKPACKLFFFLQICPREGQRLHINYQTRSMSPVDLQAQQKLIRKCVCAGGKCGRHLTALFCKELYQGGIMQQTADCYNSFYLPQISQLIKFCLLPVKSLSLSSC